MTEKNKKLDWLNRFLEGRSWGNFKRKELLLKSSYFLVIVLVVPLFFPSGRSLKYTDLTEESIVTKEIIAPFTFTVLKSDPQLAKERETAKNNVPFYFIHNQQVAKQEKNRLQDFLNYIDGLPKDIRMDIGSEPNNISTDLNGQNSINEVLKHIYDNFNPKVTTQDIIQLLNIRLDENYPLLKALAIKTIHDLYLNTIINEAKSAVVSNKVVLITDGVESDEEFSAVLDIASSRKFILDRFKTVENGTLISRLLFSYIKPNAEFDSLRTGKEQQDAIAQVPIGADIVYKNERIIDANERVTPEIYQKLRSLEIAMAEKSQAEGDWRGYLFEFGTYLLTIFIVFMLAFYIAKNKPEIFRDDKKLILVNLIIFLQVGIGAVIIGPLGWSNFVVPTTISSMLLSILLDTGIGLIGTMVIGLLLGGIFGLDYSFAAMTIIVGFVAVYSVAHIRTRNQIFRAIILIFSAYLLVTFTYSMLRYEDFESTLKVIAYWILPNAIFSPFITFMSLGVFEKVFDITTDVTLLELSDMNHPLLKKLATKAPGTFHHSIVVGNLAESAAKEIGANSLLARVGSYYHDIGKMQKSEYFVENQQGGENKHESLAPNMSALILAAHVKNGIDMAEEYGLPKLISNFIPEHHGTNLMSYFYAKAKELDPEINENDYRYPGPKPQSKETAIVMLADTVEAASRTIKNPTPGKLRKMVKEFVEKKFLDGELEDCNLTMRELKGITDGFVSVLVGIHHERIEYPNEDKKTVKKNNGRENQKNSE